MFDSQTEQIPGFREHMILESGVWLTEQVTFLALNQTSDVLLTDV